MMKSSLKRALSMLLVVCMLLTLAACGGDSSDSSSSSGGDQSGDTYTYRAYTQALGTNWNPHAWETNADDLIQSYIQTPFVTISIQDSENGVYQWVYEAATSITDVTADHQDDLTKYNVTLPEGQTVEDTTEGYVFEIKLNEDMKWENGEAITADDYIYSMKALLDPDMKNYRANLYYAGESAVAGGNEYYYGGGIAWDTDVEGAYALDTLVAGEDGTYTSADGAPLAFALNSALAWLGGETMTTYVDSYGEDMFDMTAWESLQELAVGGFVDVTDESIELFAQLITASPDWGETEADVINYMYTGEMMPEVEYDGTVGCYKVDEYTIRYVNDAYIDINYFLASCTSSWLVYEDLYEEGKDTTGTLVTTDYATSVETTMSFGPYKLDSIQDGRQAVFVRNENWYGYETDENGKLVSYTDFDVDGESVRQYMADSIVIDVMQNEAAKQAFLKGELSEWTPTAEDLVSYAASEQLYRIDETYTMSFFFNTNLEALQTMDESKGNTNSVVLSNENFRKAFSLAIDRDEYVTATEGWKPAYALMNNLYFYDVYNDPTSSYRNSEPAMEAICNLYEVEYGEGTAYATLRDAYESINGYNLTEAKELMATACDELVAAGLYTEGEDIVIRIAWGAGGLGAADNRQLELMNKYINAAIEGSGFGTVTLEAVGNLSDRYGDVPRGEYAIGYGAWGGAAFYPFRNMQVYCDTEQYSINELGCWDPATETLTINVNGTDDTMTWQDWSRALVGTGKYSTADFETKLQITATLEEEYLKKYYRIPLAGTTICSLLSYQVSYYTDEYNIMYDFGGFRLMSFNFTDAEWADFVSEQGGTLNYE